MKTNTTPGDRVEIPPNSKIYKSYISYIFNMIPGDSTESPDEFFFNVTSFNCLNFKRGFM